MLVSYKLLQSYFDEKIPSPEKLKDLFTFHVFEVESYSSEVLDLKILPDRACYCLCHMGIARELSAITGIAIKEHKYKELSISPEVKNLQITLNSKVCDRYVGRRIENITVGDSPEWLKNYLGILEA